MAVSQASHSERHEKNSAASINGKLKNDETFKARAKWVERER